MTAIPLRERPQGRRERVDLARIATLTWTLGVTDWKLRFYGSVLGYVWSLVRPFAFFGVVYLVFTKVTHLGAGVPHYALYILFAMVLFQFFTEVTTNCLLSLTTRESLLRKMRFPKVAIPLSVALTGLLNLGMTLLAVFVFALATGVDPRWSWLELPVIVAALATFALGVGMLLSVLFVRYRDVQPIWEVFSQALFYASPVLYVATIVPSQFRELFLANPLASALTEMRHAVVDSGAPHVWSVTEGGVSLLVAFGIVALAVVAGAFAFNREAPRIAERL
jgi:ABC-2 type transport system permease protein